MGKRVKPQPPKSLDDAFFRVEHEQMRKVLEQIAARKRKTVEQRLAWSCLAFLDAMADDRAECADGRRKTIQMAAQHGDGG